MPLSHEAYVEKISQSKIYDMVLKTPCEPAPKLSKKLDVPVLLKREDLQPVFSFKCRGAYNKALSLTEEERSKGVIAASAGNHAQGLAMAANRLSIKAIIVMPTTTPQIKVDAVRNWGAEVMLFGDAFDEAQAKAMALSGELGMTYVPPFNDPEVIAGQGTVALELVDQCENMAAVFVPIGGGGLMAGMAAYLKAKKPGVKVIGVEPEDAACFLAARRAGTPVTLSEVGIFADGVAVARIGDETFRLMQNLVDDVITVSTDAICAAIKDLYDETRSIAEPAGALALAGMKRYAELHRAPTQDVNQMIVPIEAGDWVVVVSGANMNFDRLRYVSERTEIGERKEALLAVSIPEIQGSFTLFCNALGERNVTEFNYRYGASGVAHVFVGVSTQDRDVEVKELTESLYHSGYDVEDMSGNEVAKLHARYMVGGHPPGGIEEHIFRFEFPERPGALKKFLTQLGRHWNITLFHYRNHGSAYGRVLVGFEVAKAQLPGLHKSFQKLGYPFFDETHNAAYRLFLK